MNINGINVLDLIKETGGLEKYQHLSWPRLIKARIWSFLERYTL